MTFSVAQVSYEARFAPLARIWDGRIQPNWPGVNWSPMSVQPPLAPLDPHFFRLERPLFLADHWAPMLPDGAIISDGFCVAPMFMMGIGWHEPIPDRTFKVCGKAIYCDTEAFFVTGKTGNYYHWLFDDLARILLYLKSVEPRAKMPLALPNELPAYAAQTLEICGIDPATCLRVPNGSLAFKAATAASLMNVYDAVHPLALYILDKSFGHLTVPCAGRRLLVSRADAPGRRLVNEDALVHALAPLGFERVTLGGRDFADQVRLFSAAEIVVAPHGAGLANIAWMHRGGSALVELLCEGSHLHMYEAIAGRRGLGYRKVAGTDLGRGDNDFVVPAEAVVNAVRELLAS